MTIREIEELLRRTMGLEATTIGASTVERAVRQRMAQTHVPTTGEYHAMLQSQPEELHQLIEAVVVPESWFFRDVAPFTALRRWVLGEWLPAHPNQILRVLCVPCSTGEEPYSVAMTLLAAGLPPERFAVDAVDISRHALAAAERAVYSATSFRGSELEFRDRYFVPSTEGYVLAPEVRRQVRFFQGNLLAPGFRAEGGVYQVVFCRNLLIYFDRATQAKAVGVLKGLLAVDGLFFVGHAEAGALAGSALTPAEFPMSFAFRKTPVAAPSATSPASPFPKTTRLVPSPPTPTRSRGNTRRIFTDQPAHLPLPEPSLHAKASPPADGLAKARELANRGRLEEARQLCEAHLRTEGASSAAWYLLGVASDAAGDRRRAAECYAKTLYLEPNHLEALLQQALLAEQAGDTAGAEQFRRRIARVQQRKQPA